MRKLLLIKHAAPEVVPTLPPEQWRLSAAGRLKCKPLAARLAPHAPAVVISSSEPKAIETAEVLAVELGVPCETGNDLFEHDRTNVPHLPSREFISMMELLFRRPRELVLGLETAEEALGRFRAAVDAVLRTHPEGNIAVVSHGAVIALFLAHHTRQDGFRLWRRLQLPSFAVLSVPTLSLQEMVERVD